MRNKHLNRMISGWSFGELQTFVEYKAARAGLKIEHIHPVYTSKTCAICGEYGIRRQAIFRCTTCGMSHADVNAAANITGGGICKPSRINADCEASVSHDAVESGLF